MIPQEIHDSLAVHIEKHERGHKQGFYSTSFCVLPEGFEFWNGGVKCDMAVGPCACGAWHNAKDTLGRSFRVVENNHGK